MKKKQPSGPILPVDPELALKQFTTLLEIAPQLRGKIASAPEFGAWESDVKIALSKFYGTIWFTPGSYYHGQPKSELVDALNRGLEQAILFLGSRKKDWEQQPSSPRAALKSGVNPKDVFVVHGRDHGIKETIARFLSKLKLNPITNTIAPK